MRGGAAAGLALLVTACGGAGAAAPDLGLQVASEYGRHAAVQGKVDLYVTNTGSGEVAVDGYQVRHPMFEVLPMTPRTSLLPNDGQHRVVPIPFGKPRCDVQEATGAQVVVRVQRGDEVEDVTLPLGDREPGLVRAHRLACAADAVAAVAAFELRTDGRRQQTGRGEVLETTLHLSRRAPGEVIVTEMIGSILFTPEGEPAAPLVVLPADRQEASVPVLLRASRCDRHAMIESKTSFTFPFFATVGSEEPARLTVTATGAARQALQALLDDTCGAIE